MQCSACLASAPTHTPHNLLVSQIKTSINSEECFYLDITQHCGKGDAVWEVNRWDAFKCSRQAVKTPKCDAEQTGLPREINVSTGTLQETAQSAKHHKWNLPPRHPLRWTMPSFPALICAFDSLSALYRHRWKESTAHEPTLKLITGRRSCHIRPHVTDLAFLFHLCQKRCVMHEVQVGQE